MKLKQTSMIIGLAVLLNFSIPITWADKKTAIIVGSAGGGAAAVIGGALWYKLTNLKHIQKVEVELDGQPINYYKTYAVYDALKNKNFGGRVTEEVIEKINKGIKHINVNKIKSSMVKISMKTAGKALKIDVTTDSEQIVDDVVKLESNEAEKNVSEISNIVNDISEDNVSTPPDSNGFSSIVDDYGQTDIDDISGEMSMLERSLY